MFDTLGKKGGRHTGTFFGFFIAARLPKHHLSTESKEAVEATWGIIATISALVLSLLLSTAKSSFDTVNTEVTQSATKIIIGHKVVKLKPVHGFAAETSAAAVVQLARRAYLLTSGEPFRLRLAENG